ncbi:MAG: hypothetical protein ACI901_001710 [Octadecabacter sp.]|jgi:hypothetical protein
MAQPQAPLTAVALMITATLFIAGTMLAAKSLGTDILGAPLHPLQVTQGRFLFAFMGFIVARSVLRPKICNPNITFHL